MTERRATQELLGAKLGVDFEGEFTRGASIDIAKVPVRRLRTTISKADREQVSGTGGRATPFRPGRARGRVRHGSRHAR